MTDLLMYHVIAPLLEKINRCYPSVEPIDVLLMKSIVPVQRPGQHVIYRLLIKDNLVEVSYNKYFL